MDITRSQASKKKNQHNSPQIMTTQLYTILLTLLIYMCL